MTNPDRLLRALPHLAYEIMMFRRIGEYLIREPDPDVTNPGHSIQRNALIEAFVIHARLLVEFLYHSKKKGRVGAGHYLGESRLGVKISPTLTDLRNRANKAAAHLTWDRIQIASHPWDFDVITRDMNKVLEDFFGKMVEPYRTQLQQVVCRNPYPCFQGSSVKNDTRTESSGSPSI